VLFGGLATWWGGPETSLYDFGLGAVALGLCVVFAFASERPVSSLKGLALRAADGLLALTNVTKIFGDVLSYLRLFALGLASASLAVTFNTLAVQVMDSMPGVGLLFGLLILIVGHTLNLALSIMSGVVHGLRLNFIEFYNWGLSEEGYPFKAFERKAVRS
jgi:V/A-type H+-transporting ATPase subunit I